MLRTWLTALGMTALLAACGGGDPPDSLTGVTVLNNDASGVTPLCSTGLSGSIFIGDQQQSVELKVPLVAVGYQATVRYPVSFINQIKKGKNLKVSFFCEQTPDIFVNLHGTVAEDYKSKGGDYSITVNGTKAPVGGYSNCVRPDAPNVSVPCVFGGAALGLPTPKRL